MPRVIVNSTPLIVLGNLNRLELLRQLYGDVVIPQAVFREVCEKIDAASKQISDIGWIHVERVLDPINRRIFQAKLHDGEVEVMLLAMQSPKADLVIIDDNAAKKTAKFLGLTVTGTLGVILKAKRNGLVPCVSPVLKDLENLGFFIGDEVRSLVLQQAGEML